MRTGRLRDTNRREFLNRIAIAAVAGVPGLAPQPAEAEPPPETTKIRLFRVPGLCLAPQYIAEELLRAEGFTDIQYLSFPEGGAAVYEHLDKGDIDITQWFVAPFVQEVDRGADILFLSGVHIGCFELIGTGSVYTLRDLKGKTLAVPWLGPGPETFIATILSYVGLDPRDVRYVVRPPADTPRLLSEGQIDAYLGFAPMPQLLRAKGIGRVVLNSSQDPPWSNFFCCLAAGNRNFVSEHPVATKRVLRAILKADRICAEQPELAARSMVARGFIGDYDMAVQSLRDIPYGRWRELDPEDTVRFYALRLREVGMIENTPKSIIARGTDWRFLDELRKELKA